MSVVSVVAGVVKDDDAVLIFFTLALVLRVVLVVLLALAFVVVVVLFRFPLSFVAIDVAVVDFVLVSTVFDDVTSSAVVCDISVVGIHALLVLLLSTVCPAA